MRTRAQIEGDIPTTEPGNYGFNQVITLLKLLIEVALDIREQEATIKTSVV